MTPALLRYLTLGLVDEVFSDPPGPPTAALTREIEADPAAVVAALEGRSPPVRGPALQALLTAAKRGDDPTRATARHLAAGLMIDGADVLAAARHQRDLGGWGRGTRRLFADWYTEQSAAELAVRVRRHPAVAGFTHRDVLRLAHARPEDPTRRALLGTVAAGEVGPVPVDEIEPATWLAWAVEDPEAPREGLASAWARGSAAPGANLAARLLGLPARPRPEPGRWLVVTDEGPLMDGRPAEAPRGVSVTCAAAARAVREALAATGEVIDARFAPGPAGDGGPPRARVVPPDTGSPGPVDLAAAIVAGVDAEVDAVLVLTHAFPADDEARTRAALRDARAPLVLGLLAPSAAPGPSQAGMTQALGLTLATIDLILALSAPRRTRT